MVWTNGVVTTISEDYMLNYIWNSVIMAEWTEDETDLKLKAEFEEYLDSHYTPTEIIKLCDPPVGEKKWDRQMFFMDWIKVQIDIFRGFDEMETFEKMTGWKEVK